ncbi:MAG: hypothetical protein KKF00_03955, partial [Proteobacteria bacterium]|nr:hypothetical protein [Pseudomonadota bacterium]
MEVRKRCNGIKYRISSFKVRFTIHEHRLTNQRPGNKYMFNSELNTPAAELEERIKKFQIHL